MLTRADIDREQVARRGLSEFVKRAWRQVVPDPLRWSWHMDAVCAHLEAVSSGQVRDLVICEPPGCSKSLLVSTFWPAWDWIANPTRRLIAATYAQDLSDKNARLHRDLVMSDWFRERWGHVCEIRHQDKARVRMFENSAKGWRFSSSTGGAMTGFHGDVLLFDDLVNAKDAQGRAYVDPQAIEKANDFWFKVMYTRRADAATTRRVGIAQRLHHDDTPGKCIEAGYTALVLPMEYDPARPCKTRVYWTAPGATEPTPFEDPRKEAGELLAPDRFPREVVDRDKSPLGLGAQAHEAQNQQNPTPREGNILKNVARNRWTWATLPPKFDQRIITVDCAFKKTDTSDLVPIQVWGKAGTKFYFLDRMIPERRGIMDTIQAILIMAAKWPGVPIHVEDKANGPAVVETLRGHIPIIQEWSPGTDSKESRASAVAPLFDAGCVWVPDESICPVEDWASTLSRFPLVKHDDDVDATTMALLILYQPLVTQYMQAVEELRKGW